MCSRKKDEKPAIGDRRAAIGGDPFPVRSSQLAVGINREPKTENREPLEASFTLLELLTAIAILGILVTILFSSFRSVSDVTTRSANKTEVNQVVRAVLDQIVRDLERVVYRSNTLNMYQDPNMTGSWVGGAVPTNTLYFLTDIPTADGNPFGYPVNVGYQIQWSTNAGGINKAVLMRGDDPGVQATGPCTNQWWNNNCTVCSCPFFVNTNAATENLTYWKVFSENVIGIQFNFYTNAAASYTADSFSSQAGYVQTWGSLVTTNPLPYSVGVQIWTIDTDTYNKALRVDPSLTGAGTNLIINNMHTYFTRVFLPSSTQNP